MNLVSKKQMVEFKRLDDLVTAMGDDRVEYTDAESEIIADWSVLMDRYDRMGISTTGYIEYYGLSK